jgi:hypothetical protein
LARKLTASVVAAIQERRRQGVDVRQLAAEFKLSNGSISTALKMPPPAALERPERPAAKSKAERARAKSKRQPFDHAEIRASLSGIARTLNELAENARRSKDPAAYLTIAKAATMAIKEIGRFTPPPDVEEDDAPDVRAAAKRCREKLQELLERELERRRKGAA